VRLIRSKGVGVFFVTQQPTDIPDEVLGQLGARVQHALRAFTPNDAKDLRATVSTYPRSEFYDLDTLLTSMGTGEAAVTLLSESGVPTPVAHTRLVAPASRMAPADDVAGAATASPLWAHYGERTDPQSAREILAARLDPPAAQTPEAPAEPAGTPTPEPPLEHIPIPESMRGPQRRRPRSRAPAPADSTPDAIGDFLNSRSGRALQKEIVRGVFGLLKKRR